MVFLHTNMLNKKENEKMKKVYFVYHQYILYDCPEIKFIGVFSSIKIAKDVVKRYKKMEGFKKYKENFYIQEYLVDI